MVDPVKFTSKSDAATSVRAALASSEGEFDIDAIVDEVFAWDIEVDTDGNELLSTGGYVQVVDTDEFWTIVDRHDMSA